MLHSDIGRRGPFIESTNELRGSSMGPRASFNFSVLPLKRQRDVREYDSLWYERGDLRFKGSKAKSLKPKVLVK